MDLMGEGQVAGSMLKAKSGRRKKANQVMAFCFGVSNMRYRC